MFHQVLLFLHFFYNTYVYIFSALNSVGIKKSAHVQKLIVGGFTGRKKNYQNKTSKDQPMTFR